MEKASPVEGYYKVKGFEQTDAGKKPYKTLVTISKANEGYVLNFASGVNGLGVLDKDLMIVTWMQDKHIGVTVMTRKGDNWEGYWIATPRVQRNPETWTFLVPLDEE